MDGMHYFGKNLPDGRNSNAEAEHRSATRVAILMIVVSMTITIGAIVSLCAVSPPNPALSEMQQPVFE